ncbi:MucR family transcriptional regulator [Methylobacterium sp. Leaf117]|uniref:MucR family transcriptional regulator n=1 Tax=Methylobacterium sp. Leaf117 TaxID=1736260 RepID=UPI0006FFBCA2|nr:MucR family transcriptional regulator [Methylobacterium sp. Leaf117]KQP77450.1 MucR family transcriptional regulator [Methylobacterium sp. Leaf117]
MSQNTENQTTNITALAGDIVSAYVSNNSVRPADLPDLIRQVHTALQALTTEGATASSEAEIEKPSAAQIRKSVTPDGIVSFLDGKTYKTMKRHLTGHRLDPHSYRHRYGLPVDYPMVAPSYAAMRSQLAKSIGLGRIADRSEDTQPKAKGRKKTT